MWTGIIFFSGILVFLLLTILTKLYKFKGTKLKTRMSYALALSLFFTLYFLWQTQGKAQIIGRGLILGMLLSIPLCLYHKRWIDNKIEGNKILYKMKKTYLNILWAVLGVVIVELLMSQDTGKQFMASIWPILGLCLAWFFSQVYIFFYVVKLERRLGVPILEDKRVE
jgi:hypothetical protein